MPETAPTSAALPRLGDIVHYRLDESDVAVIEQGRGPRYRESMPGLIGPGNRVTVYHDQRGRPVAAGDLVALVVTRVDEDGTLGGKVLLDGTDSLWREEVRPERWEARSER